MHLKEMKKDEEKEKKMRTREEKARKRKHENNEHDWLMNERKKMQEHWKTNKKKSLSLQVCKFVKKKEILWKLNQKLNMQKKKNYKKEKKK